VMMKTKRRKVLRATGTTTTTVVVVKGRGGRRGVEAKKGGLGCDYKECGVSSIRVEGGRHKMSGFPGRRQVNG